MTRVLKISADLSLPLDALTQTIAILAKRRVGKSYTMRRLVEQLFKAGQQVVIVDPKGDQWGIRSAADGKAPGLAVVILGGERGDVPLAPNGGEVVAKLVVEERVSVLLDISLFRKHEVATFMTAFLENLYRLKAREIYRTPMMLVIDEADAIAPQKPQKGEERMLGAAEDVVRRGGQRGIGCVLVTQRSAVLNKNVLTQAQMLVALRTIAPQDLAAMDAWIQVHGEPDQRKTLMESLPSLPIGDAWFWSPGWPTVEGIFQRVHVLPIETFDSGATPKPGEKRIEPKQAADVDLEALKRQMAATIEKAKAEDPKELRKRIAELEKQVKAKVPATAPAKVETKTIEKPVLKDGQLKGAEKVGERVSAMGERLADLSTAYLRAAQELTRAIEGANHSQTIPKVFPVHRQVAAPPSVRAANSSSTRASGATVSPLHPKGDSDLTGARLRIVRALAELESIGIAQATRPQLGFYVGLNLRSGHGSRTVGTLHTEGMVDYVGDARLALSDAGRAAAGDVDQPASLSEFHDRVREYLSGLELRVFDAVVSLGRSGSVTREELGELTGVNHSSGHGSRVVGALNTAGIVIYPTKGSVGPSDLLFPESLS